MKTALALFIVIAFSSCSISKKIGKEAKETVINSKALEAAHVGISIYEPATGKYWFNYQGEKYFVPASNTKLPTCYAAMKYLGDSIAGLQYTIQDNKLMIRGTGDPTLLQEDFVKQPVVDFLKSQVSNGQQIVYVPNPRNSIPQWGSGWGWSDYDADYMAERNEFPVYGNIITIKHNSIGASVQTGTHLFDSLLKQAASSGSVDLRTGKFGITRKLDSNDFSFIPSSSTFGPTRITFVTDGVTITLAVLRDLLNQGITMATTPSSANWKTIYSQSTDSLLRITMHRSDNFFAEQSLLMVSNKLLGYMDDDQIIDTLLKTDFKDLPQKPRWVDGCGLSRYNLFTPQDFVAILGKMKNDFGMNRIKTILATGGEGTISSYYKQDSGYIYAKTGTLSGVVALSGFLETKDHKQLIFSVLVNNHRSSATEVRRAVERFLQTIRNNY